MRETLLNLFVCLLFSSVVLAEDGLVSLQSPHDVKTTADRLETALLNKGMTVFSRIDHALGAQQTGQSLRPTELVIFGNPKVGTALMLCQQKIAIDLPLKALIWEDENGQVWFSYNDPEYLADRHALSGCEPVLAKVKKALANFAQAAVGG